MQEVECSTFAEEFSFLSPLYSAVPPKDDSKAQVSGFVFDRVSQQNSEATVHHIHSYTIS